jgi:hypothetical protein
LLLHLALLGTAASSPASRVASNVSGQHIKQSQKARSLQLLRPGPEITSKGKIEKHFRTGLVKS